MEKTCLPSIKFLLDSPPIDDNRGPSFSYTPSHPTPMDPIITSNGSSYHHISSQSNPDAHHLAAINAHNKQVMNISSQSPHPSNIKSLLSPPESPDMATSHQQSPFDSYGAQVPRHEERYNISQVSQQQQCSCYANKPSSTYSVSAPVMNTYSQQHSVSNYNLYIQPVQGYSSFSPTLQPNPISSYDRKSTVSPHSLTRLNTSTLGLPLPTAKLYPQKSLPGHLLPSGSSGNRYQCPYCSKRFSRPSSLRIHIYSHTGEKPFVCTEPGCGRKFSVQSNMRRHLRVHRLGRPVKKTRYDGDKINQLTINKTLWANLSDDEILELLGGEDGVFRTIEELFAAKEIALRKKKVEKKDEISVIDSKRAYNINLILGRYKQYTFKEIHQKIIEMDELFCTENLLNQLMQHTPTPEERGKLMVYKDGSDETLENLARADRFFVEVMKIHRYQQRLKFMYFYVTFNEKFNDLDQSVVSILNASIALKESKHFKELLSLILLLGNYMNGSGHKGGAFGFKISSINKLVDTKASNTSSVTLLHFLANTIDERLPHVAEFTEELKECGFACRVSQQEMTNEYRSMGTQLNDLDIELQKNFTDVELEENDKFPIIMNDFVVKSKRKFEELKVKYTSMEVAYKDVVAYFGEDPNNTKPDEFFGIFKIFIASFEKSKHDNKRQREHEIAAQKRKEELENRRKNAHANPNVRVTPTSQDSQDSLEEKHLMDNLLETLRDGRDLDTRSRRKRGEREKRVGRSMSIALKAESILNSLKEDEPPMPEIPKEIVTK